jgi:UDPglucose 6-dehydrogenase
MQLQVLRAVEQVNHDQKRLLLAKVVRRFGEQLAGRRFALWGLAFKANTDDMREAPSRVVIDGLLERGARVRAYDPAAEQEARRLYADQTGLDYAATPMAALDGADALIIVTEWKEFRSPDFGDIRGRLREPVLFDGRNLYDPALVRSAGLEYHGVGRGTGV